MVDRYKQKQTMHGTQCGLYRGMMSSFKVEKMQLITSGGGNTPLLRYQSTSAYGNESHNGTRLSLAKSKFLPHRGLLSSSALVSPLLSFSLIYSFLLLPGSFWTLHMSLDLWLWLILINCCWGLPHFLLLVLWVQYKKVNSFMRKYHWNETIL